jgi:hypothetical protein
METIKPHIDHLDKKEVLNYFRTHCPLTNEHHSAMIEPMKELFEHFGTNACEP